MITIADDFFAVRELYLVTIEVMSLADKRDAALSPKFIVEPVANSQLTHRRPAGRRGQWRI